MGTVAAGAWSDVAADGDVACAYTMDVFFDDQRVEANVAAGAVKGENRHWYYEFKAPYTANHQFAFYRYRSCDGEKELISVAGIEATLL